jgi:hypothetical protein
MCNALNCGLDSEHSLPKRRASQNHELTPQLSRLPLVTAHAEP